MALGVSPLERRWETLQWPITDYQDLFFVDNLALYLTGFLGANWWIVHLNKVEIQHITGGNERIVLRSKALAGII